MTVTWRSAVFYALFITVLSRLIGIGVELALLAVSGGLGDWRTTVAAGPWELAFPAAAVLTLTAARRFLTPLPRWRVILTDGVLYTVVLLVCGGVTAWAAGDEAPADTAFVLGIFALYNLQLPAAWLLSAWRSGQLAVVITPTPPAHGCRS